MEWNIDGLAQIAADAWGLEWDRLSGEEKDALRAVARAVLHAVLSALSV